MPNETTGKSRAEQNTRSYNLDRPYSQKSTIAGVNVELYVSEVTVPVGYDGMNFLSSPPVEVTDEYAFRDIATADKYTIKASRETVIDGGDSTSVRFLEHTLMEEVGIARKVKEELMKNGVDVDMPLDEMAQNAEDSVVQLYRNTDIKNAELMAKGILFNASEGDILGSEDIPDSSEIRNWVDSTREQLEVALEALENIDSLARQSLGDDYGNPSGDSKLTTDIEEIRKMIYDSNHRTSGTFVEREKELSDGGILKIETNAITTDLILKENGKEETLYTSKSDAEVLSEFNQELNQRN